MGLVRKTIGAQQPKKEGHVFQAWAQDKGRGSSGYLLALNFSVDAGGTYEVGQVWEVLGFAIGPISGNTKWS